MFDATNKAWKLDDWFQLFFNIKSIKIHGQTYQGGHFIRLTKFTHNPRLSTVLFLDFNNSKKTAVPFKSHITPARLFLRKVC